MKIEPNNIYNMDCVEGMKQMDDKSVDLILTDPPFNVNLSYSDVNDDLNDDKYSQWCHEWIEELYRVLKKGRYAVIFTGDKKLFYVMKAIYGTDFMFHHFLKWNKPSSQRALSGTVFFCRTELAFVLSKGKPDLSKINRDVLYADTLRYDNTTPKDDNAVNHNARRPVELYKRIIDGFGGELVLDNFIGSGTTAVACKKLDRQYIGFEISEEYCDIAEERINNVVKSKNFMNFVGDDDE